MDKEYQVVWCMEITAATPRDAIAEALKNFGDGATCFAVTPKDENGEWDKDMTQYIDGDGVEYDD